jgi:hypothetical protein
MRKIGKPEGEKRAIPVKELPTFRGEPNENAMYFFLFGTSKEADSMTGGMQRS